MSQQYPKVEVFLTKDYKVRAKIQEKAFSIPYEVTVGGQRWNEGRGRDFEAKIWAKVRLMQAHIEGTLVEHFDM